MNYRSLLAAAAVVICIFSSTFSHAQNPQSNFSISPPPLGYPEYPEESVVSHSLNFTGAFIRGKDISFNGIFAGWVPRYGGEWGAIQGMLGMFVMNGNIDTGFGEESLNFVGFNAAPAFELPVVNTESFKFIFFGGFDFMLSTTSFTTDDPFSTGALTVTLTTAMFGPLLGMQAHFNVGGGMMISPFFMVKSLKGSTDVSTDPAYVVLQDSYDIPSTTVMSYGLDIIETTSGVTLSGLLQMTGKTDDTQEMKTYIISFRFKV